MVCKRLFLSGKVQGVGLRFRACEEASKLSLKGYIKNLEDGRVEVIIAGSNENVAKLIQWFKAGAPGQVKNIEESAVTSDIPTEEFYIRREGR